MNDFELIRLAFDETRGTGDLAGWLVAERLTIAITKANSLFLVGVDAGGLPAVTGCVYGLCMGLTAVGADTLLLATRYQIWRLENALPPGQTTDAGHDRLYLPQTAWTTGTLLVRDLAATATVDRVCQRPVLVSEQSKPATELRTRLGRRRSSRAWRPRSDAT